MCSISSWGHCAPGARLRRPALGRSATHGEADLHEHGADDEEETAPATSPRRWPGAPRGWLTTSPTSALRRPEVSEAARACCDWPTRAAATASDPLRHRARAPRVAARPRRRPVRSCVNTMATTSQAAMAALTRMSVTVRSWADTGRSVAPRLMARPGRYAGTGTSRRPGKPGVASKSPARMPAAACCDLRACTVELPRGRRCPPDDVALEEVQLDRCGSLVVLCLPGQRVQLQLQRAASALAGAGRVAHIAGLVVGDDEAVRGLAHRVVASPDAVTSDAHGERLLDRDDSDPAPLGRSLDETGQGRGARLRGARPRAPAKGSLRSASARERLARAASMLDGLASQAPERWRPPPPGAGRCRRPARDAAGWARGPGGAAGT